MKSCFKVQKIAQHTFSTTLVEIKITCVYKSTILTVTVSPMFTAESRGEQCPICGAVYRHRYSLGKHMKSHDGQTRCTVCGQHFSTMQNLRRHMLMTHQMTREQVDRLTNNIRARHGSLEAQRVTPMSDEAQ